MAPLIKINFYQIFSRSFFGIIIVLLSYLINYILHPYFVYSEFISGFLIIAAFLIYYFLLEKDVLTIVRRDDNSVIKLHDFFYENSNTFAFSLAALFFLLGLILATKFPIIHPFLGSIILSTIFGIIIRSLLYKIKLFFLINRKTILFFIYLFIVFLSLIISFLSLSIHNKGYLSVLLIGTPLGYIIMSIKYIYKQFLFKSILTASQDYLFITQSYIINKENWLRPLQLFLLGRYRGAIKTLKFYPSPQSEIEDFVVKSLIFRCFLYIKDKEKAQNLFENIIIKYPDKQLTAYHYFLLNLISERRIEDSEKILLNIINEYRENTLPIVRINLSYIYNKKMQYDDAISVLNPIIHRKQGEFEQLNSKIDWIYALNNHCFSIAKKILVKNKFFNLLDSSLNVNEINYFQYDNEDYDNLNEATLHLSLANLLVSQLKMSSEWRFVKTHRGREFSLGITYSLLEFAKGNFYAAINILNSGLEKFPKRSYPFKLLCLYNLVVGNNRTAFLNYLEYKHLKSYYSKEDKYFEKSIILPLLKMKSKPQIEIIPLKYLP